MLIKKNILKALVILTNFKKISLYMLRLHWVFLISVKVLIGVKNLKRVKVSPFNYVLEIKNASVYFGNLDIFYIKQLLNNWNLFFKSSIFVFKKKVRKWSVLRSVFVHSTSKETLALSECKMRLCFQSKSNNFLINKFFICKMAGKLAGRSSNFMHLRIIHCSYYEEKNNSIRLS